MKLNIFKTPDDALTSLAVYFVVTAARSIAESGQFSVALSGGSSPKKLYELLASPVFKDNVEWDKVHFFFGDERNVPQTDPDSNYLMAKKAMFSPLELRSSQVFAIDTSLPPAEAAKKYTDDINNYFAGEEARLDLVLLGLGDNSHTASLFPHTSILHEKTASVKEVFVDELGGVYRLSMTAPLINQARCIAYLVYGDGKASAVRHIIEGERDIENYPAQLISPKKGDLQWFMDTAAASKLKNN